MFGEVNMNLMDLACAGKIDFKKLRDFDKGSHR